MSTYPGDLAVTRSLGIGTLNLKLPEAHPRCTICGCDVTDFRFEAFGFISVDGTFGSHPVEYVLITTCLAHFHEPLAARLRAAAA